jgi:parallel beta-helix repeat protein
MSAGILTLLLALIGANSAAQAGPAPSMVLYVSPGGSDSAAGSAHAPLRSISAAVNRAPANGTVVVRSGTYHENVTILRNSPVHLESAPHATVWLDGSRAVTNWNAAGGRWVANNWTAKFDASPTLTKGAPDGTKPSWRFVNPAYPMAAHPDQVWIDGAAQRQVGSLDKVRPGSFYVDYSSSRLYLGSNPHGRDVRASDLPKAISVRAPGTTITGINVRRYAPSVPTMGAVTVERPGVSVSHLQIVDNATSGLQVGVSGVRLTDLFLARNGMIGLRANKADGMRLKNVTVKNNNVERFNPAPSAGGAKITGSTGVRVVASRFADNYGTGLWFDASDYKFAVTGSRFLNNALHGLFLEVSGTGTVTNNLIAHNKANGLEINDTDKVQVWNNTFSDNLKTILIAQDWRDVNPSGAYHNPNLPLPWRSQNITIRNNILANPTPGATCVLCVEDYSHRFSAERLNISADGNLYQRPTQMRPQWLVVWSRGPGNPARYDRVRNVRSSISQEHSGRVLNGLAALTEGLTPTYAVTSRAAKSAYRVPAWVAAEAHVKAGTKHFGSWLR